MTQLATQQPTTALRERIEVIDAIPILDTSRFEHMQRIATVMARSTLIPESLYMEGKKDEKQPLPYEQILSNCFLVVNQAVRWGLDPFAVAQCVSVVHGKLCYEGKLVAAVLQAKLNLNLHHVIIGAGEETRIYLSDRTFSDEVTIDGQTGPLSSFLAPRIRVPGFRLFDGSVSEWKTSGNNSPWSPKNYTRMLLYRGTRDWCRVYEPATMLGVYTDDELDDMEETSRSRIAKDVTPQQPSVMQRLRAAQEASQEPQDEREGFSAAHVARETSDALTGEIIEPGDSSPPADAVTTAASQEDGGQTTSEPPSSPSLSPSDRGLLIECCAKFMSITVDQTLETPQQKRGVLESAKNTWKEALPPELHDHLKGIFLSSDAIIKGEADRAKAIAEFAYWLECAPEELGG